MYFWLKFTHIAAMAVWFSGLFFLPRLFIAQLRNGEAMESARFAAMGKTLYFGIATPAGLLTILFGMVLMADGFQGAWLPAKLVLVAVAVLLHAYCGMLLFELSRGYTRHGILGYRLLSWTPLALLVAIAALAAAKPGLLPPLGGS